jgi:hypothetical protein
MYPHVCLDAVIQQATVTTTVTTTFKQLVT